MAVPTNKSAGESKLQEMRRALRRSDQCSQGNQPPTAMQTAGSTLGAASGADIGEEGFSMWDVADPDAGARTALELFGSSAAVAVAEAAFTARYAGREVDFRFWFATFIKLRRLSADDGKDS